MSEILIVDDEPQIRKMLARALEHHGYSVIVAGEGLEALDLCWQYKPRLIFLDMMMPGMDGAAVVRSLKETLGDAAPPVVLVTARTLPSGKISEIGAVAYVQKPFRIKQILSLADQYAPKDT